MVVVAMCFLPAWSFPLVRASQIEEAEKELGTVVLAEWQIHRPESFGFVIIKEEMTWGVFFLAAKVASRG